MSSKNGNGLAGLPLTVLLYQETSASGVWVAQVLERDMAAHGPTLEAAVTAVQHVFQAHLEFDKRHQIEPLSRLNPAPTVFWEARNNGARAISPFANSPFTSAHIVTLASREAAGVKH